jgi:hypothetical protein
MNADTLRAAVGLSVVIVTSARIHGTASVSMS